MNTWSAILRSLVESEVGQRWTLADCIAHLLFWLLQCALCCYQSAKACILCVCYYYYSGTKSLTATGGCRLFCSALPVRSA